MMTMRRRRRTRLGVSMGGCGCDDVRPKGLATGTRLVEGLGVGPEGVEVWAEPTGGVLFLEGRGICASS